MKRVMHKTLECTVEKNGLFSSVVLKVTDRVKYCVYMVGNKIMSGGKNCGQIGYLKSVMTSKLFTLSNVSYICLMGARYHFNKKKYY